MDLGLKGRVVLVTGGSQGLGRATAESFAREGCRLRLVARDAARLEQARAAIAAQYGVEVVAQAADMAAPGAAEALGRAFPDSDILVNNAGGIMRGDVLAVDEARWRAAWESKVFGYINMTREFLRRMQTRGGGVIVNIIGIGGEKLEYDYTAGSTGNAALAAFTRAVGGGSIERGVRVVGIHPGWVDTERGMGFMRDSAKKIFDDPERWREVYASWPLSRMIEAREVADVAVFLASARASAVTGTIVNVDLGLGARSYPRPPAPLGSS